ncbi:hydroxyectoine utilization dehydratase EutB [Lutibaculum baratangense]|uniref:Threonine dehydratase, catabolic n=1 Tax=Lutibaculum baratangense AMV1 TaxID=631454 RepID=V4RL37_9HYPH|nr:hydroxyectoine utilization dehydratase EutB [Lutibaculum baratangense]ESR23925.1 Threonine dehydratase, catabolic [Lutibaculum baratangense AMV1]
MPGLSQIYDALRTIRENGVPETPLVRSELSDRGAEVLLKLETLQPTGAFKLRGATNAIARLAPYQRERGVVCASTGNHGRAVAHAARAMGTRAIVCLSALVPDTKAKAIEALGAQVRRVGRSQDDAQREVERLVAENGMAAVPPFDDEDVIAGQGTIAIELLAARPDLEAIVVPLSGGGLMAGIAAAAKAMKPRIRMIGVSMDRGAAMAESLRAGRPVETEEVASLADSLGGGIGLRNRHTFALCRDLVDEVILVTEDEIYRGMRSLFHDDRLVAEGASATGHAALLAGKLELSGPTAFILSGRNVDMAQFAAVVAGEPVRVGDMSVGGQHEAPA